MLNRLRQCEFQVHHTRDAACFELLGSLTLFVLLLFNSSSARASTATYQGATAGSVSWTTPGIWTGGSGLNGAPIAGDDVVFPNTLTLTGALTLTLDGAQACRSVTLGIAPGAFIFTIAVGSGSALTLGDGTNAGVLTATQNAAITCPIVLSNNLTANVSGGVTLTCGGAITGAFSVTKTTGVGTLVFTGGNSYSAGTIISAGTLQIGNSVVNGTFGAGTYSIANSAKLYLNCATAAAPLWANITGAGTLELNSAQAVDGSANWGTCGLPSGFTGTLKLDNGRINGTPANLGGTTNFVIGNGGQFLAFDGTLNGAAYSFPQNFSIIGMGWGESGANFGAIRNSGMAATFSGSITLTGNSGFFDQNTQATSKFTGVISDGGAGYTLQTVGGGAITFTNANTYTGTTTVAFGTLILGDGTSGRDGTLSGTSIVNNATLIYNIFSTTYPTYSGVISGMGSVTKMGGGNLTLTGANSFAGQLTISGGIFVVPAAANLAAAGNAQSIGTASQMNINGGTFRAPTSGNALTSFNPTINIGAGGGTIDTQSGFLFYGGSFTGSGTLTVITSTNTASAWLLYTGSSSAYTGNIVIGNGTNTNCGIQYRSGVANPFGSGSITVNAGATLSCDNSTGTIPNVIVMNGGNFGTQAANCTYSGTVSLQANSSIGSPFTGNSTSGSITVSNVISGNGSLTKLTADTAILSNSNSYAGGTIVGAGTLKLSTGNDRLPTAGALTLSGGTLDLNGLNQTVATLNGFGGAITSSSTGVGTLTVTGGGNYYGSLNDGGTGKQFALNVSGSTLLLEGTGTLTGGVKITAGTLGAAGTNALGTGTTTISSGATLSLRPFIINNGFSASNYALNGGATISNGVLTLTDNNSSEARSAFCLAPQVISGNFTANFTYTPSGNKSADGVAFVIQNDPRGSAALGASGGSLGYGGAGLINNSVAVELNIYTGGPGGIGVAIGLNGSIPTSTSVAPVSLGGGNPISVNLVYDATAQTITETYTDTVTNATKTIGPLSVNVQTQLGGSIGYVGFTGGTGGLTATQTISNFTFTTPLTSPVNTYSGAISVPAAANSTIEVANPASSNASAISGTLTMGSGSTLNISTNGLASNTPFSLALGATTFSGGVATISVNNNGAGAGVASLGVVSQTVPSGITKTGAGKLIIGGISTYTGPTSVVGGTLKAGVASVNGTGGAFGFNSALTLANVAGVALDITGFDTSIGSLTGGGTTGGNVVLGSNTLTVGGDGSSPAAFSGTISGAGGVTLSGGGTLTLNGTNSFTGATTLSSGSLNLLSSLDAASAVAVNGTSALIYGKLGGSGTVNGTLAVNSFGHVAPSLANGSANNTLHTASNVSLNSGANVDIVFTVNGVANDLISGNGGNTLTTPGIPGSVTVNIFNSAGGLPNGTYMLFGNFASVSSTIPTDFVIGISPLSGKKYSFASTGTGITISIFDAGGSTWNGASAIGNNWSSGANWVAGSQPAPGDLLTFGGTTRLAPNNDLAALTSFLGITFDSTAGAFTLGGNAVTLTGNIVNNSANNQIISTPLALSGPRIIDTGAQNISIAASLSGSSLLAKNGTGTLSLNADNTLFTGSIMLDAGSARFLTANSLPITAVTVNSGATLDVSGNSFTLNSLTGGGNVTSSAAGTPVLMLTNSGGTTFSGMISDGSSSGLALVLQSSGVFTLSGSNTFTGGTTINSGMLQLGVASALSTSGSISVNGASTVLDLGGFTTTPVGAVTLVGGTIQNGTLTGASYAVQSGTISAILAGTGAMTKSTSGIVNLTTANTFSGGTTINAGTLNYAVANALPPTGAINVNGSTAVLDLGAFATSASGAVTMTDGVIQNGTLTGSSYAVQNGTIAANLAGTGALTKSNSGTVVATGVNTYSGGTAISGGTLQLGNGSVNGTVVGNYSIANGTTLYLNYATAISRAFTNLSGAGTLRLNSAQAVNGTAKWGLDNPAGTTFNSSFTGTLQVDNGRIDASSASSASAGLGGVSNIIINTGAQFLAWSGTYNVPITIAGFGWGEAGQPNALRLAGNNVGTWAGNVALSANAGIEAQFGGTFTITGSITGNYLLQFDAQTGATLNVTPSAAEQNSYGSTQISNSSGGTTGAVVAGNPYAFSTGGLLMNPNGVLKLNNFSFAFANLNGTGGTIGNYGTTTLSTLTIGDDNSAANYAGALIDGGVQPLAVAKVGTGMLTLSGANTYSGGTTVNAGIVAAVGTTPLGAASGRLAVNNPNIGAGSSVVLNLSTTAVTTTGSLSGSLATPGSGINSAIIDNGGQLFTVNQTSPGTFEGVIVGTGGFTLGSSSTDKLTLSGANSYSGPTSVSGGILSIASTGSIASSTCTVYPNAQLRGTGSAGDVATSGGPGAAPTIWPGVATKVSDLAHNEFLNVASVNIVGGGKLAIVISNAQNACQQLSSSSSLTLNSSSILSLAFDTGTNGNTFTIVNAPGGISAPFANVIGIPNYNANGTSNSSSADVNYVNGSTVLYTNPAPGTIMTGVTAIQIKFNATVTPVTLDAFTAKLQDLGVTLSWHCVCEFQNAGFNLYRQAAGESQWVRINPALIAGRITHADEKTYSYYDWTDPGIYCYKLESIALNGLSECYATIAGPVTFDPVTAPENVDGAAIDATANTFQNESTCRNAVAVCKAFKLIAEKDKELVSPSVRSLSVNQAQTMPSSVASNSLANSASAAVRWFSTGALFSRNHTAAKVRYVQPGVLAIPQSSMPAGFDINHVAVQREGIVLPILAVKDSTLYVYAQGYSDDYTNTDALFIRSTTAPAAAGYVAHSSGLFTDTQQVNTDSPASVSSSYHDVYFDYNTAYRPYSFAPWFSSQYLTDGIDQQFSIVTPRASDGPASLTVTLWSLTPEHALQVLINGQPAGEARWTGGQQMIQLTFQVPFGALKAGSNQIDLVTPNLSGVASQICFVHDLTMNYTQSLDGSQPVTIINSGKVSNLYQVSNLPRPDAWVVDTRYPSRPALVPFESRQQSNGTYALRFIGAKGGTGQYLVVPFGQENTPVSIAKCRVKPIAKTAYLAIGPLSFSAGVQPLLLKHGKEGLRGQFVDQEQLFDYYNHGRYGPSGIKNAVRSTLPKYLLLVGRTTYDYLNYSGTNVDPLCPAFLVPTTFWAQTTSDSRFGDLGRGYPEVAVGRLPINNTAELAVAVQHILAYGGAPTSGVRVHAVADRTDLSAGDFSAEAAGVAQAIPELTWQANYLGVTHSSSPEVTAAMNAAANGGADWLLYVGHGNAVRLGSSSLSILDTLSVQNWTGNTVFLQSTCTANWMAKDVQDYRSIAIQALVQPQGGISASIGTSTYMNSSCAVTFMTQLMQTANASGMRWGDALLKTQQWASRQGQSYYDDLSRTEQLFGDPAMRVFSKSSSNNGATGTSPATANQTGGQF